MQSSSEIVTTKKPTPSFSQARCPSWLPADSESTEAIITGVLLLKIIPKFIGCKYQPIYDTSNIG